MFPRRRQYLPLPPPADDGLPPPLAAPDYFREGFSWAPGAFQGAGAFALLMPACGNC